MVSNVAISRILTVRSYSGYSPRWTRVSIGELWVGSKNVGTMYAKLVPPVMDGAICLFISAVFPLVGVVQPSTNTLLNCSVSLALHPRSPVVGIVDGVLQALRMRQRKTPSSLFAIDTCPPCRSALEGERGQHTQVEHRRGISPATELV